MSLLPHQTKGQYPKSTSFFRHTSMPFHPWKVLLCSHVQIPDLYWNGESLQTQIEDLLRLGLKSSHVSPSQALAPPRALWVHFRKQ